MKYIEEVQKGMNLIASQDNSIFVGQAMRFKGHAVSRQVEIFPKEKLLEFPVAEEMQMGFCIGLALQGYLPICVYPRFNFALLACNQIVNHLDKMELMSDGRCIPKVIIKVVVGSEHPLDPGWQHKGNYAEVFAVLCETMAVYDLSYPQNIVSTYKTALKSHRSTMIVERGDLYAE